MPLNSYRVMVTMEVRAESADMAERLVQEREWSSLTPYVPTETKPYVRPVVVSTAVRLKDAR